MDSAIHNPQIEHVNSLALLNAVQDGVAILDDGVVLFANNALCELLNCQLDVLVKQRFSDFFSSDFTSKIEALLQKSASESEANSEAKSEIEVELSCTNITRTLILTCGTLVELNRDQLIVVTVRDISWHAKLVKQFRESERELKQIIRNMPGIFYRTDAEGNLIKASPYALRILGYSFSEAIGKPMTHFYANPEERSETLQKILASNGDAVAVETLMRCKDGSTFWVSTSAYARFKADGEFLGVEGVSLNITKQKDLEYELREKAIRDPLTLLYNRSGIIELIDRALQRSVRDNSNCSILLIDLIGFKELNEKLGHKLGDEYLKEFAVRLNNSFRASDNIARIVGAEFVVLLSDDTSAETVKDLLWRLQDTMQRFYEIKGELLEFNYQVGQANYPKNGTSAEELIDFADRNTQPFIST
ncbi:sensor domain-containing diguanylate cyclase [Aliikangiella sp. IMCC44653]